MSDTKWSHFQSPLEVWKNMPAFLLMEILMTALVAAMFVHAKVNGTRYLLLWFTALVIGFANDQLFLMLPMTENFYHARGTIMLTERLPLEVVFQYVVFIYPSMVTVWRMRLPVFKEAAIASLLGSLIQMLNDVINAKFILYTWHDSDPTLKYRFMGVAVGNNSFVLAFLFAFSVLLRTPSKVKYGIAILFTTPLAVVLVTFSQIIFQDGEGPIPTHLSYILIILLMLSVGFLTPGARALNTPISLADHALVITMATHAAVLTLMMGFLPPESQTSFGFHEYFSPNDTQCREQVQDELSGMKRNRYLCQKISRGDFDFHCTEPPKQITNLYTICGKPHENRYHSTLFMLDLGMLEVIIMLIIIYKRTKPSKKKK